MKDIDVSHSKKVIKSKIESMDSNQIWRLVVLPNRVKPIECKWLYKGNREIDRKVEIFKARLIAKCYTQKEEINYEEIFSFVTMINSIHILLSIVTILNYEI